jgi:uncharacterized membrane protein
MYAELLVLRIVHVLGAIIWAGTSLFVAVFLMPALGTVGPAASPVMGALVKRKLFTIIPIVAVIVILAGLRLMWISSNGYSPAYFSTRGGMTYSLGAVCALVAFTIFMTVSHPAIGRSMQLGQQMAQAPEAEKGALAVQMGAVRARAAKAAIASALLLTLTSVAMAIGRYV